MNHAARAFVLLAAGLLLRDCTLLAASVLLWSVHLQQRLDAAADRAHAWSRCVLDGALLLLAGLLLGTHTAAVVFGWWPLREESAVLLSTALLLTAAWGGLSWRELGWRHVLAASGAIVTIVHAWTPLVWAGCAFAASVALLALWEGARHLGPMAAALAASHRDR